MRGGDRNTQSCRPECLVLPAPYLVAPDLGLLPVLWTHGSSWFSVVPVYFRNRTERKLIRCNATT